MKKLLPIVIFSMLSLGVANAQEEKVDLETTKKIRQEGLQNSKVMDIAFNLTDVNGRVRISSETQESKETFIQKAHLFYEYRTLMNMMIEIAEVITT
jgi:hypothetical protein